MLNAAYNDAAGVTAKFNLNLLARINRELGANFDLARSAIRPSTIPSATASRCISPATSARRCGWPAGSIEFRAGETIHTENSYKYTLESFGALARGSGWRPLAVWTDPGGISPSMRWLRGRVTRPCGAGDRVETWLRKSRVGAFAHPRPLIFAPMPICEADPWRLQYFEHAAVRPASTFRPRTATPGSGIPSIAGSTTRSRSRRARASMPAARHAAAALPVFSKPIVNLKGMGIGSRVLRSPPSTSSGSRPAICG